MAGAAGAAGAGGAPAYVGGGAAAAGAGEAVLVLGGIVVIIAVNADTNAAAMEHAQQNKDKSEFFEERDGKGDSETAKKPTSQNQMQNQVKKDQAPKGVDRVDPADTNIPDSQPHIHIGENEAALNQDGTWHDAGKTHPTITNKIEKWILENGWNLPTE